MSEVDESKFAVWEKVLEKAEEEIRTQVGKVLVILTNEACFPH